MAATATVLTDIVSVDKVYVYFDAPERDALRYRRLVQKKKLDDRTTARSRSTSASSTRPVSRTAA